MIQYAKTFGEADYISSLIKKFKKKKKSGTKYRYNTNFIAYQFTMTNILTKVKSCNGTINTDFHDSGIPKDGFLSIQFLIILIDSVFGISKNSYPQLFQKNVNTLLKKERWKDTLIAITSK